MNLIKGWLGEAETALTMWFFLNEKIYKRFHNTIIPGINGTTQIDHLVVSRYGLFIVETKNLKGWIYGSEKQSKWTQTLFKNKFSFQNPVRQTFRQKKVLSEFLGANESINNTVVYFTGNCQFKTAMPKNVINSGLSRYIKRFKNQVLSQGEVEDILKAIRDHRSQSSLTKRDHIRSLKQRHSSTTTCSKCGGKLVERIAKQGAKKGSRFLGCENYPRCRFTKNL